jgi:hypothetical protein
MVYFGTAGIIPENATVLSARLYLYLSDYDHMINQSANVSVYKVKQAWNEYEATWRQRQVGLDWAVVGCAGAADRDQVPVSTTIVSTVNRWYQWNVTGMVQEWASSPSTNYGLLLASDSGRELRFWSKDVPDNWSQNVYRPYLRVEYIPSGFVPTPAVTATPGGPTATPPPPQSAEIRTVSRDTYINNYDPTRNYEMGGLRVRGTGNNRALLDFDISVIPDRASIISAALRLTTATSGEVGDNFPDLSLDVGAYLVRRQWSASTATWQFPWQSPGCDDTIIDRSGTSSSITTITSVTAPGTTVHYQWDVRSIVQAWLDDRVNPSRTTAGLILIGLTQNHRVVGFRDSHYGDTRFHPVLYVEWTNATPTPMPTATATSTPTASPTPPATATPTATATATATPTSTATPTATPVLGAIQGTVFNDFVGGVANGQRDPGELGLPNATVELWRDGVMLDSHITVGDGEYHFSGLSLGDYTLIEIPPSGFAASTPTTVQVTLSETHNVVVVDFGNYNPHVVTPLRKVFIPLIDKRR